MKLVFIGHASVQKFNIIYSVYLDKETNKYYTCDQFPPSKYCGTIINSKYEQEMAYLRQNLLQVKSIDFVNNRIINGRGIQFQFIPSREELVIT